MNSTYKTMKKTFILTIIMIFTFSVSVFAADVAKIDETAYATLNEAIEAVQDGETITLVANAEGGFDVGNSTGTAPKKFTIDLAGNEIDLKKPVGSTNTVTNGIRVLANSELTIKNGTINASSEDVKVVIANYGKLTLNGVTVKSGVNTLYTINNRGNLTLEGATVVETSKAGDNIAITNDPYDYIYTDVNAILNIGSEEVKVGTILVERYARNTKNTGVPEINISAGTIEKIKDDGETSIEFIGNITGGSYANPVDVKFLNPENVVELKDGDENNLAPYTYYKTVADALEASNVNSVITDLTNEETLYAITLDYNDDGKKQQITVNENEVIILPVITKSGYDFKGWKVGEDKYEGNAEYTVTGDATLTAVWERKPAGGGTSGGDNSEGGNLEDDTSGDDNSTENKWENPYTDVAEEDWYYEAIEFVDLNELFNGVTTDAFAPNMNMTRGMLITVLYRHARIDNEKSVLDNVNDKKISFEDVKEDMYYSLPISWAAENEIVNGIGDNKFAPDREVTREELVAILYRYAKVIEKDVSVEEDTNTLSYDDIAEVSEYAIPAFKWACEAGIVTGRTESTLAPKDVATRAEVATMLMRFCK